MLVKFSLFIPKYYHMLYTITIKKKSKKSKGKIRRITGKGAKKDTDLRNER